MEKRFLIVFLLCAFGVMAVSGAGELHAAVPGAQRPSVTAPEEPVLKRASCGWDYPCSAQPDYGRPPASFYRRLSRQPGQLYIHNNYGTVNIHVDGISTRGGPERPCCEGTTGEDAGWRPPCGPVPCEEERPKEDCGVRCWWRRFRDGYCGHGCWAYREQARIEAEVREEKEEQRAEKEERREEREAGYRPLFHPWGYPPPPVYDRRVEHRNAPTHYERPKIDEHTSLGRFEGPKYPAE